MEALPKKWDTITDVLIVGSGFAGLAAALEIHNAGVPVIILEKMRYHGGNSIISGGFYNCVDPERQKAQGIEDSVDLHYQQTLAGGDYIGEPDKIRYVVEHALEGWQWLESMGLEQEGAIVQLYGALWPRTHSPKYKEKKNGPAIVAVLYEQVKNRGIPLLLKHEVTRIIRQDCLEGKILGVEVLAKDKKLYFKARRALVLAAGGFCASVEMRMKHDPRLDDRFTTHNHAGATGEILNMAADVGASLKGLDYIQSMGPAGRDLRCMPRPAGVSQMSHVMNLGGLSTNSTIYLNFRGERIVACDARRDQITNAVLNTPEKMCYVINDLKGLGTSGRTFSALSLEEAITIITRYPREAVMADTIRELATKTGMDPDILEQTIIRFNSYVEAKYDPEFHQAPHNLIYKIDTPPFFAASGSPAVHYMCGGLQIETATCRVVDRWGHIIPGLYAAGEIVGGIHGTNRLGGNAIADCIVFGRLAGKSATVETPFD